jgi:hypothetical protein
VDTPLCHTGIEQGKTLYRFITKDYNVDKDTRLENLSLLFFLSS